MVHKNKIESNKKLIYKKNFCFPKFPLFNPLASFDLNLLEKGWAKYFKNGLKLFHISQPSICTAYLFWVRMLIQIASPDSSGCVSRFQWHLLNRHYTILHILSNKVLNVQCCHWNLETHPEPWIKLCRLLIIEIIIEYMANPIFKIPISKILSQIECKLKNRRM